MQLRAIIHQLIYDAQQDPLLHDTVAQVEPWHDLFGKFDNGLPAVLAAHICTQGHQITS